MDYLDWIIYGSGAALGLLTIGLGYSRLSGSVERDISPLTQLVFIVCGAALALALVFGWIFPVRTVVYLANGGNTPRQVKVGDDILCLPGKSFEDFSWRLDSPDAVIVGGGKERETRYPIGKGTWFINTAPTLVSADMYAGANSVAFDAFNSTSAGAFRIDSHYGRPFRMFTQSSFYRVYSADGDMVERITSGPCAAPPPRRSAEQ